MRIRPAIFLSLLFLSGCYNSPVSEPTAELPDSSAQSAADLTMENKPTPASDPTSAESTPEEALVADALAQIQAGSAILVDVRRDEEWEEGHFEAARHIPLDSINENAEAAFAEIEKEQTVFVH